MLDISYLMSLLCLCLVLSVVPSETRFFPPGKVYTYSVQGDMLLSPPWGIPKTNASTRITTMEYFIQVGASSPNTIVLQPRTFRSIDTQTKQNQAMSSKVRNMLEFPMELSLSTKGIPISMRVQPNISKWAMNLKKGQVSQFILNVGDPRATNYVIDESSVLGQCQTQYGVRQGRITARAGRTKRKSWFYEEQTDPRSWSEWVSEVDSHVGEGFTKGISNEWNSMEESSEGIDTTEADWYYNELFQFCQPGSKIFEFRKLVESQNCINNYSAAATVKGTSATQYITCGANRQNLIILEITHVLSTSGINHVQNLALVRIDPAPLNSDILPVMPSPNIQVTDLSFQSNRNLVPTKDREGDISKLRSTSTSQQETLPSLQLLRPIINPQQENTPASQLRPPQESNDIGNLDQAFRRCLVRAGANNRKLVSRDLNSNYYNLLNRQWNLRREKVYPRAYFLPTTTSDVADAVKCGLAARIRLVANSGGHSYEAISSGSNDTVIVDFRNMKRISIEGRGGQAVGRIEPGALVGNINAYLWENGGYAVPMGNCMTVGIGGHAIGGGVGFFATQYGLTIDNVLEYEVVDGRGSIVVANAQENPDLFWALRGSGPGYIGIVTSFKVKLFQASRLNITLIVMIYPVRDFASTYVAYQNMLRWINLNDPGVFMYFSLNNDLFNANQPRLVPGGIRYTVAHIQDPNGHRRNSSSLVKALGQIFPPTILTVLRTVNYIQFVYMTSYAPVTLHGIQVPSPPNPAVSQTDTQILSFFTSLQKEDASPRYFKAKSFFIKRYFTQAQLSRVGEVLKRIPQHNIWILCNTEQGMIQRVRKNATAYVHRDVALDITIHYEGSADPGQVETGMKFLYELWDTMQFMDGGQTYQNYPDLEVQDRLVRNYGQNLGRLIRQKRKWDPTNYFLTPLSLPITPEQRGSVTPVIQKRNGLHADLFNEHFIRKGFQWRNP